MWGGIPGTPPGVVPLFETPELISHQDYCPGNVVFRDGLPAALIDFDLSRPTTRVADIVNALYWWTPLMHPDDRPPGMRDADVPARVRIFADA
jgi:Ser/Thr protein kinase RdoA (MazF antagonist)